jgi:hypothetical protein
VKTLHGLDAHVSGPTDTAISTARCAALRCAGNGRWAVGDGQRADAVAALAQDVAKAHDGGGGNGSSSSSRRAGTATYLLARQSNGARCGVVLSMRALVCQSAPGVWCARPSLSRSWYNDAMC